VNYTMKTCGVCARTIDFSIDDGRLHDVRFNGGCPGNTTAVSRLLEGADARSAAGTLKGITCAQRPTSCCDQLARGIEQALAEQRPAVPQEGAEAERAREADRQAG
jgi:uncharacterized protein (TIGR03905 family)